MSILFITLQKYDHINFMAIDTSFEHYAVSHDKNGSGGGSTVIRGNIKNTNIPSDLQVTSITAARGNINNLHGTSESFNDAEFVYLTTSEGKILKIKGDELNYTIGSIDELKSGKITTDSIKSNDLYSTNAVIDALNSTNITTEYLTVTKQAHFFELVIDKVKSVGGSLIITGANSVIAYVKAFDRNNAEVPMFDSNGDPIAESTIDSAAAYFKVYWIGKDENTGRENEDEWYIGDQAYCQSFNVHEGKNFNASNKYYWRKVIAHEDPVYMNLKTGEELQSGQSELYNEVYINTPTLSYTVDGTTYNVNKGWNVAVQQMSEVTWTPDSSVVDGTTCGTMGTKGTTFGIQLTPNTSTGSIQNIVPETFSFTCDKSRLGVGFVYQDGSYEWFAAPEQGQTSYTFSLTTSTPIDAVIIINADEVEWKLVRGIRLSNTTKDSNLKDGASIPSIGDNIAQLGHRYNEEDSELGQNKDAAKERGSAIIIAAYHTPDKGETINGTYKRGLTPPSYAQYKLINDFHLTRFRHTFFDAKGSAFYGNFYAGTDTSGYDELEAGTPELFVAYAEDNGQGQADPNHWTKTPQTNVVYDFMGYATATVPPGSTKAAVEQTLQFNNYDWKMVPNATGTNGINGSYTQYAYKNAVSAPSSPSSTSTYPPTGWTKTASTPSDGQYTWCIERTIVYTSNNTIDYTQCPWSSAYRISGSNGQQGPQGLTGPQGTDGSDGDGVEYIFACVDDINTAAPPRITSVSDPTLSGIENNLLQAGTNYNIIAWKRYPNDTWKYVTDNDYIPPSKKVYHTADSNYKVAGYYPDTDWTDDPQELNATNKKVEYVAQRKYNGTTQSWSSFSSPEIWAMYGGTGPQGTDGSDGTDFEFIYTRNNDGTVPAAPVYDSNNNPVNTQDDWYGTDSNGIVWEDHPQGVQSDLKYEFMVQRSKPAGQQTWNAYAPNPAALWSKYGENGRDGDGIEYIYACTDDINTAPPPRITSVTDPALANIENGLLQAGTNYNIIAWKRYPDDTWKYVTDNDYIPPSKKVYHTADSNYKVAGYYPDTDWTDDPQELNATDKKVEYVAQRKYNGTTQTWSSFSSPEIWAMYGGTGPQGPQGNPGPQGSNGTGYKLVNVGSKASYSVTLDSSNNTVIDFDTYFTYKIARIVNGEVYYLTAQERNNFTINGVTYFLYPYVKLKDTTVSNDPSDWKDQWYILTAIGHGAPEEECFYSFVSNGLTAAQKETFINNNQIFEIALIPILKYSTQQTVPAILNPDDYATEINNALDKQEIKLTMSSSAQFQIIQGPQASIKALVTGQQAMSELLIGPQGIQSRVDDLKDGFGGIQSQINQLPDEIEMSVYDTINQQTGIDITNGKISLNANNTEVNGGLLTVNTGSGIAWTDQNGTPKINIHAGDLVGNFSKATEAISYSSKGTENMINLSYNTSQRTGTITKEWIIQTNYNMLGKLPQGATISVSGITALCGIDVGRFDYARTTNYIQSKLELIYDSTVIATDTKNITSLSAQSGTVNHSTLSTTVGSGQTSGVWKICATIDLNNANIDISSIYGAWCYGQWSNGSYTVNFGTAQDYKVLEMANDGIDFYTSGSDHMKFKQDNFELTTGNYSGIKIDSSNKIPVQRYMNGDDPTSDWGGLGTQLRIDTNANAGILSFNYDAYVFTNSSIPNVSNFTIGTDGYLGRMIYLIGERNLNLIAANTNIHILTPSGSTTNRITIGQGVHTMICYNISKSNSTTSYYWAVS